MKKGLSIREKVLLIILGIVAAIAVYYYLFLIPTQDEIARLKEQSVSIQNALSLTESKINNLNKMKAELESIKAGDNTDTKPLPAFDNRQNMMVELYAILLNTENYSISYGTDTDDGTTVSRSVRLNYSCGSYEAAKAILIAIQDGEYPCTFGNLNFSNEGRNVSVDITFFEYK